MKNIMLSVLMVSFVFAQDDSWMLYDDNQVAIINITTSPEAVDYMFTPENFESDSMHMATVHFSNALIDETIDSVAFRIRGNTSRHSAKKSFKLNFEHFVPGREFYDVDKLNINGEHNDPSVIRSKLAWDFFNEIGVVSARAAHAAVYINDMYYGLYISIEHYDKEFLKKNFDNPDGNLWKCLYDGSAADLQVRGAGLPSDYDPVLSGQGGYALKTNEEQNDFSKLAQLIDIINNTSDQQFPIEIEKILNMNSFVKVMAMDVILGSWDDYWSLTNNYYLYHQPEQDRFYFIPYDYDNIMSIDWFEKNWAMEDMYNWYKINDSSRPLVDRMLNDDYYYNMYTHFVEFYNEHLFTLGLWENRLDSIYTMIRPFAIPDSFRTWDWSFSMEDFDNSYGMDYENQHVKNGIRQYVTTRNATIAGQLQYRDASPLIYRLKYTPQLPVAGEEITIDVSTFDNDGLAAVELKYRINNGSLSTQAFSYNPVAGTKKVEEYDNWSIQINAPGPGDKFDFIVSVTDMKGNIQNYPELDLVSIQIPQTGNDAVVINEFLARNTAGIQDENEQFEDWIELYNTSEEAIDLAGYHLTDRSDNLAKWSFPDSGSVIEPFGFLLVWCDEDQQQGVLHTNFKLSAAGEFIGLSGPDGVTVLDSFSFGAQSANISVGRQPDGSETWDLLSPTPGASNTVTSIIDNLLKPEDFYLKAYPNPFNSTVKVSYHLKQASDVNAAIYNILGELIWQHEFQRQKAGSHFFSWDGRTNDYKDVSSGLYIIKLQKGPETENTKIILVK